MGGAAAMAAPFGAGGEGSTQRGEQSRMGSFQGKNNRQWRGQNTSWGSVSRDVSGGAFGKGGLSPAQMVQVFGEAMRQMGSASLGGKGFGHAKGSGGPRVWACRNCQCVDNWPDRELCRICGVSWKFKGEPAAGGRDGAQGGVGPGRSPSKGRGMDDLLGKGKGKAGKSGGRSASPNGPIHFATSTGQWGQKGGGGAWRKGRGEHGPAGAAAPLDGAWQEQGKGRSVSRNRLGLENLDTKVQDSVHLLLQALQPDAQAKGKGMAGLAGRKGKGKGEPDKMERVFDQGAIDRCVNKIKHLRIMLESATAMRNQGGFEAPVAEWTQEVGVLVLELDTLKKGVERVVPGVVPMAQDRDDEQDIDEEGYMAGQRRWKTDPNVSLGDKIQRSLTREAKLFKAQARIQSEVDKLVVVIDLAREKIAERIARIKEVAGSMEAERSERAAWQKEYEEKEYPEDSSDSEFEDWDQQEGLAEECGERRGHGQKRSRRDEGTHFRRGRASDKDDVGGVPRALKVILGALQPRCQESADLRKCAEAVLRKFNLREMGQDIDHEAGGDVWTRPAQDALRLEAMERGAKEACERVAGLEEQTERLRKEGLDARNAYQQQRAYIQSQLGEGADATKLHEFLKGLVDSMDAQFGIVGSAGDAGPRGGGSNYSPGSSLCRVSGRSRQEDRKSGSEDRARGQNRERSPRLGHDKEGGSGAAGL